MTQICSMRSHCGYLCAEYPCRKVRRCGRGIAVAVPGDRSAFFDTGCRQWDGVCLLASRHTAGGRPLTHDGGCRMVRAPSRLLPGHCCRDTAAGAWRASSCGWEGLAWAKLVACRCRAQGARACLGLALDGAVPCARRADRLGAGQRPGPTVSGPARLERNGLGPNGSRGRGSQMFRASRTRYQLSTTGTARAASGWAG
jgi:hypothetical protein